MRFWIVLLATAMCVGSAVAGPKCTAEPKTKWLSQDAFRSKLDSLGYVYKAVKVTDGHCYEIYGRNKAGQRVEIYFNPVTGEIVEEHKS